MQEFFESYIAAFLSAEVAKVANFCSFPVTIFSEDGESVVFDEQSFNSNSEKLFEIYQKLMVTDIACEILSEQMMNPMFTLVSMQWTFMGAHKQTIYCATTRYLVQTQSMNIVAITVVDESTKIQALLG